MTRLSPSDPDLIRSVLTRSNREFIAEEAVVDSTAEDAEVRAHIARWMTGRKVAGQSHAARGPDLDDG